MKNGIIGGFIGFILGVFGMAFAVALLADSARQDQTIGEYKNNIGL